MPVTKPFRRTCRQFDDGTYTGANRCIYITHGQFAKAPEHYIRAFLLIQKDLREIFDYIEPSDKNVDCYSYRIHGLLMRVCIEVEANCKAILAENAYGKVNNLSMNDYRNLNHTHHLSSYQVKLPVWRGTNRVWTPFTSWTAGQSSPIWYKAYNAAKHDRQDNFEQANFGNLVDATCGLVALLSSQFLTHDFSGDIPPRIRVRGPPHFDNAIVVMRSS